MRKEEQNANLPLDSSDEEYLTSHEITRIAAVISPYPPPEHARVYEELYPGFMENTFKEIQNRGNRRHQLDFLGIVFAFLIVIAGMCVSVFSLYLHEPIAAGVTFTTTVALAGVFIARKPSKEKQSEK